LSDPPPKKARRDRLDASLVESGLAESRSRAQGLILSGRVLLDGEVVTRCGAQVRTGQTISLSPAPRPYASRGGSKLEGALDDLGISCEGKTALDVGAATGGFTDCLLRRGAARVYAVDVGEKLIDDRLRKDRRVVVLEKVNFRYAPPDLLPEKVSLATVDVSFISLRHILPRLRGFLRPRSDALALVKPQFEVGRAFVGKGGVVRDEAMRQEAVRTVAEFASGLGFSVAGRAESRVKGPRGNREVFLHLKWETGAPAQNDLDFT
jgi:23S rRNA (cytidine1920-2'-O)/16S rRNA (cytidine1409-2'-O)-methyltransferase